MGAQLPVNRQKLNLQRLAAGCGAGGSLSAVLGQLELVNVKLANIVAAVLVLVACVLVGRLLDLNRAEGKSARGKQAE